MKKGTPAVSEPKAKKERKAIDRLTFATKAKELWNGSPRGTLNDLAKATEQTLPATRRHLRKLNQLLVTNGHEPLDFNLEDPVMNLFRDHPTRRDPQTPD